MCCMGMHMFSWAWTRARRHAWPVRAEPVLTSLPRVKKNRPTLCHPRPRPRPQHRLLASEAVKASLRHAHTHPTYYMPHYTSGCTATCVRLGRALAATCTALHLATARLNLCTDAARQQHLPYYVRTYVYARVLYSLCL